MTEKTLEDLQWELDKALEKGQTKKAEKLAKELEKRGEYKTL